jgi:hypothetical protein
MMSLTFIAFHLIELLFEFGHGAFQFSDFFPELFRFILFRSGTDVSGLPSGAPGS